MNFRDKIRLLIPAVVEETIGDSTFKFYQCSPKALANSAQLVARLAGAASVMFADQNEDVGHTIQDWEDPDSGEKGSTTVINPASEALVAQRAKRKRSAIEEIVEGLLGDEGRKGIIMLVVNSLRDEIDRRNSDAVEDAIQRFDEMDLGHFMDFFVGMMKANAKVFGDLGKKVLARVQEVQGDASDDEAKPEAEEKAKPRPRPSLAAEGLDG